MVTELSEPSAILSHSSLATKKGVKNTENCVDAQPIGIF